MPHLPSLPDPAHLSSLFYRYPQNVPALMEFTEWVLRAPGELSIGERELIATYISGLNGCDFCFQSHKAYAIVFGIESALIEALLADIETSGVDEKLKPLLHYVKKLNDRPTGLENADSDAVYRAGWSERALYEAVQVCALFNMMNRIVLGTGVNFDYVANPDAHPASDGDAKKQAHSYKAFGRRIKEMAEKKEKAGKSGRPTLISD